MKKNRLVDEIQGVQAYQKIEELKWSQEDLETGKRVKLNGFPANHKVQLFRVIVLSDKTEFVVTNDLNCNSSQQARRHCKIRWSTAVGEVRTLRMWILAGVQIEEFHREIKQLTGIESCQSRKAVIQKNHIGCAMLLWAKLKQLAYQTGKTIYQLKHSLWDEYMTQALAYPKLKPV